MAPGMTPASGVASAPDAALAIAAAAGLGSARELHSESGVFKVYISFHGAVAMRVL